MAAVIYLELLYGLMQVSDDSTRGRLLYLLLIRLGLRTASFFSIVSGEITLSMILGYGIIVPSPFGIEVMELPSKIIVKTLIKTDWRLKNS